MYQDSLKQDMTVKKRSFGAWICTACTLNCKRCVNYSQVYHAKNDHYFIKVDDYNSDIDAAMLLHDEIDCFSITGGEPLLHPQLIDIVRYTFEYYQSKFKTLRITSNGTIIPSKDLITALKEYTADKVEFLIDDYGELSTNAKEASDRLKAENISVIYKKYYGNSQYMDGWVDLGLPNYKRNRSGNKVKDVMAKDPTYRDTVEDLIKNVENMQ